MPKDLQRKKNFTEMSKSCHFYDKLTFIDGIQDKSPTKGCYLSHLKIIETALRKGEKAIAVFEDDAKNIRKIDDHDHQLLRK